MIEQKQLVEGDPLDASFDRLVFFVNYVQIPTEIVILITTLVING